MDTTTPLQPSLAQAETALALTPPKLAVLVPYAFVLWAIAWSTIHFRGPTGAFTGIKGVLTFAGTIPVTMLINWLHLKLARLPRREIVNAIAVTLAVATTVDALCFAFFPQVYGVDQTTLMHAGGWLLWAGAIACYLAFLTRRRARGDELTHQP